MLSRVISSPLGDIIICAHEEAIVGLWFAGQKYERAGMNPELREGAKDRETLEKAAHWVRAYFAGERPEADFALAPAGTAFQKRVWAELAGIKYGQTVTYGELARRIGCKSARAVGAAVARNPISLILPCHRVLGASESLTGYAGGMERKAFLLNLEGVTGAAMPH